LYGIGKGGKKPEPAKKGGGGVPGGPVLLGIFPTNWPFRGGKKGGAGTGGGGGRAGGRHSFPLTQGPEGGPRPPKIFFQGGGRFNNPKKKFLFSSGKEIWGACFPKFPRFRGGGGGGGAFGAFFFWGRGGGGENILGFFGAQDFVWAGGTKFFFQYFPSPKVGFSRPTGNFQPRVFGFCVCLVCFGVFVVFFFLLFFLFVFFFFFFSGKKNPKPIGEKKAGGKNSNIVGLPRGPGGALEGGGETKAFSISNKS